MPNRTKKERKAIDKLKKIDASETCNARLPTGKYCKMPSGFRTDHIGDGRCYLHGGRAGRNIVSGMYSKKLVSTLKKEYDKLVTDPSLVDLYSEFALVKAIMSSIVGSLEDIMTENPTWYVQSNKGGKGISAEAATLLKVLESMRKIFRDIVAYEAKSVNQLGPKQVYNVVNQIQIVMGNTCGNCPIRSNVGNQLNDIKLAPVISEETSTNNKE